jgi:hypothetical protein
MRLEENPLIKGALRCHLSVERWHQSVDRASRRFFKPVVTSQADFYAAWPSEWQIAYQREAVIRPLTILGIAPKLRQNRIKIKGQ